jgi:molybdopterin-binding protein
MQDPYLFNMSVRDNVAYGLKIRRLKKNSIARAVDEMMERFSLTHLARRTAHTLSGGEAQRVALARTFVMDADAYLLDEPTGNVDQRNIRVIEKLILELNSEKKATIVLATHARDQAYRMSRNLISIIDGRISDIAYENVFSGVLTEESDGVRTTTLAEKVTLKVGHGKKGPVLPARRSPKGEDGSGVEGPVTIAVDPRDIILSNEEIQSSALNRFTGTITRIENVDGSLRVFVDVGVVLCALITRRSFLDMNMNIGKKVWVTFKANAVKVI